MTQELCCLSQFFHSFQFLSRLHGTVTSLRDKPFLLLVDNSDNQQAMKRNFSYY